MHVFPGLWDKSHSEPHHCAIARDIILFGEVEINRVRVCFADEG